MHCTMCFIKLGPLCIFILPCGPISAFVIFTLLSSLRSNKIKKMANNDVTFGYHPVGAPTCLRKQEVGKPSWNAAQPCAMAQGCVHDDSLRADRLRKCCRVDQVK